MHPAIVSGIVTGDAPVPEVFAKVNSAQFPSQMAHCSNRRGCHTIHCPPHPSAAGIVYLLFQASSGTRSWLGIFR